MPIPVNIRASDRKDFLDNSRSDFIVRKRPFSKRLAYSLSVWALVIVIGVTWLVVSNTLFGSLMCVVIGSITLALARQIEASSGGQIKMELLRGYVENKVTDKRKSGGRFVIDTPSGITAWRAPPSC